MGKKSKSTDTKFEYKFTLGEKHKLSISVFKNQNGDSVLNLRKFYLSSEDDWRPDRQGLTLHMEKSDKLIKAIKLLAEVADDAPEADFGDTKKKSKDTVKKGKKKSKSKDDEDEDDED